MTWRIREISAVTLAVLILTAMAAGALLSYMTVAGYYYSLGIKVPNTPTIAITNITFSKEHFDEFNFTVLNPTYSWGDANITRIYVYANRTMIAVDTWPPFPYQLRRGESQTFICYWKWWQYPKADMMVVVLVEGGAGAIAAARVPSVPSNYTGG